MRLRFMVGLSPVQQFKAVDMDSITKFYEIYKKGAFLDNKTQAYRAINFLSEFPGARTVKSEEILTRVGIVNPTGEYPLDLIDQLILTFVNELREDPRKYRHYNMLREMSLIYKNHINNISAGEPHLGVKRGKQKVSIGVVNALNNRLPVKVIEEHRVPVKELRDSLIESCEKLDDVRKIMLNKVDCVWLTKKEDDLIPKEFKAATPCGVDRYQVAGIIVHNELIRFNPSMLKRKSNAITPE